MMPRASHTKFLPAQDDPCVERLSIFADDRGFHILPLTDAMPARPRLRPSAHRRFAPPASFLTLVRISTAAMALPPSIHPMPQIAFGRRAFAVGRGAACHSENFPPLSGAMSESGRAPDLPT